MDVEPTPPDFGRLLITHRAPKDLVAAARADHHDHIDDLAISPRLGAIFQPTPSQALRLTWNRAFNSPSAPEICP